MTVLVTGGAGFIGSALCRHLLDDQRRAVVNFDALTYAGCAATAALLDGRPGYAFVQGDIRDAGAVARTLAEYKPAAVLHLAAESHVDRSIDAPALFVETNVVGTRVLLDACRAYWEALTPGARGAFRFVQVSTDEVYGSLADDAPPFTEASPCLPNSPYAASKAAADQLVRAWHATYGLPCVVTRSSNNYGPRQYPEKLIPRTILNALAGQPLALYGDGGQRRDWLQVDDHARALACVLERGRPGAVYNIGGGAERTNRAVVTAIALALDTLAPAPSGRTHADAITHVADRPGHDRRYALDTARIAGELGWRPATDFSPGLEATVAWYLDNRAWWESINPADWRDRRGAGPPVMG